MVWLHDGEQGVVVGFGESGYKHGISYRSRFAAGLASFHSFTALPVVLARSVMNVHDAVYGALV